MYLRCADSHGNLKFEGSSLKGNLLNGEMIECSSFKVERRMKFAYGNEACGFEVREEWERNSLGRNYHDFRVYENCKNKITDLRVMAQRSFSSNRNPICEDLHKNPQCDKNFLRAVTRRHFHADSKRRGSRFDRKLRGWMEEWGDGAFIIFPRPIVSALPIRPTDSTVVILMFRW